MRKLFLPLLIFLCIQSAEAQTFNVNLANKLQSTLDSLVTYFSYNTKGVSAGVYVPGQGVWMGTSGISHAGIPITTSMKLGIASNSKLFMAVAMLKLAEHNIINLNDSISKWIPTYTNVNPNITIRQLLNHTSGLSDPFFTTSLLDSIIAHPSHVYTPQDILAVLGPPVYSPGGGYNYSNLNYILAGMVVKSATGNEASVVIRDSVLTPLQLDSMFYDAEEPVIGTLAHRWHGTIDFHDTSRISLNTASGPAGALFSSSGDIVRWYNAIMNTSFLSPASFAALTTFALPGNYGLGLQRFTFFGKTTWGHGGSTIGYKSRAIYDPCMKSAVCCLSNADQSAVDGITALLYKVLIDHLPACAGTITGSVSVCQGQNAVTYTVPAITNATSYIWTLPSGATGSSLTNSITVNYGASSISGNIAVKGSNNYGMGAVSSLAVTVNPTPVVSTSSSATTICSGASASLSAFGASTYMWQPGSVSGASLSVSPSITTTYTVTGTSVYGCTKTSMHTLLVNPTCVSTLYLKVYIEAYYLGNGLMAPVLQNQSVANTTSSMTDTVTIELRNPVAPFSIAASIKTMLGSDGTAICNFQIAGSYYLVVTHRNGLQTWSANPVVLSALPLLYDFSTAAAQAYGSNQADVGNGVFAIFSGDINQDENIDLLDLVYVETDINDFQFGYFATDLNGDGNVDLLDSPIVEGNINDFVFSSHP